MQLGRINILYHFFLLILLVLVVAFLSFQLEFKGLSQNDSRRWSSGLQLLDFCWLQRSHNFASVMSGLLVVSSVNPVWEGYGTSTIVRLLNPEKTNQSYRKISYLCTHLVKRHFIPRWVLTAVSVNAQGVSSISIAASDMR